MAYSYYLIQSAIEKSSVLHEVPNIETKQLHKDVFREVEKEYFLAGKYLKLSDDTYCNWLKMQKRIAKHASRNWNKYAQVEMEKIKGMEAKREALAKKQREQEEREKKKERNEKEETARRKNVAFREGEKVKVIYHTPGYTHLWVGEFRKLTQGNTAMKLKWLNGDWQGYLEDVKVFVNGEQRIFHYDVHVEL